MATDKELSELTIASSVSPSDLVYIAQGGVSKQSPLSLLLANSPVLSVTGTANQITATPTTGSIVLSLSAAVIFPGSITAVTTYIGNGSAALPSLTFTSNPNTGIYRSASNQIGFTSNGAQVCAIDTLGLGLDTAATVYWGNGPVILKDANNVLALKNGTAAQELRVYGTTVGPQYTFISNNGSTAQVGNNSDIPLDFWVNAVARWRVGVASDGYAFYPLIDNTNQIGGGVSRASNVYSVLGTFGVATNRTDDLYIGSDSQAGLVLDTAVASVVPSAIQLYKSRSTQALRSGATGDVVNGDSVGHIISAGWSSGFLSMAYIDFVVDGTFTTSQRPPSGIKFYTNIANGSQTLALTINGSGRFGFGSSTLTSAYMLEEMPATTISGTQATFFRHTINNTNALTVSTTGGSTSNVATLRLLEPNITLSSSSVDLATTLLISSAPTEGTLNAALYVASGSSYLLGGINLGSSQSIDGTTAILLNGAQADVDLIIRSDTNANHFVSDAAVFGGVGAFGFGSAAQNFAFTVIDPPNIAAGADTSFARLFIRNAGVVTIPTGTAPIVASAYLTEPNITATGTVTLASTLYIAGAPTEGGTNAALYVASGSSYFLGNIFAGATLSIGATFATPDHVISGSSVVFNEASADIDFRIESNGNANHFVIDANTQGGIGSFGFGAAVGTSTYIVEDPPAMTFAGSSFNRHAIRSNGAISLPGASSPSLVSTLALSEPNITLNGDTLAVGATLYIVGAPTEASVNAAIYVSSGVSYFGGNVQSITDNTVALGTILNRFSSLYSVAATHGVSTNRTGAVYVGSNSADGYYADVASATAGSGPGLTLTRSRGTQASLSAISADDLLGEILFKGYSGFGNLSAAQIVAKADGSVGLADMPGRLEFYTTPDGSTTLTRRMTIKHNGDVIIGTAALATSATSGFFHIPGCAGTPTGVPANLVTGLVPLIVDVTNGRLYGYFDGAWTDLTTP